MLLLSHTSILSLVTFIILPLPQFAPSPDLCYSAARNVHMCICMHTYMCVLGACVCSHFSCATVLLPLRSPPALMLGAMYCTCTCDKDSYTTHLRLVQHASHPLSPLPSHFTSASLKGTGLKRSQLVAHP